MEERRKKRRPRTLKTGKILLNNRSVIDCAVRDLTEEGACLVVATPVGISAKFELKVPPDNFKRHCRVVWKSANRIGVTFEDAAPKK